MDRMMPIAVAFALGAVAASMVQFPSQSWSNAAGGDQVLIEPLDTGARYTLPADVAGLRVFMR
ncbi:MAG: hypothetical protein JNM30_11050 [Rhodospirillales bacterium]|nr:hypothetical protein [Rhodospirillales bacterium]